MSVLSLIYSLRQYFRRLHSPIQIYSNLPTSNLPSVDDNYTLILMTPPGIYIIPSW